MEEKDIKGVLLSGDRHGARVFSIDRESRFKLYEFNMALLGARVGPPAVDKNWTTQFFGINDIFAFAELNFNTKTGEESVELNIIDENEKILFTKSFSFKELTPSNFKNKKI